MTEIEERRLRMHNAVQEANKAFWAVIEKHFPEIEGDLDPFGESEFNKAQKCAAMNWFVNGIKTQKP